ncbi:uncharacterized protein LDX57_007848 [Aspergillus melleus]|uniref:uncharacterized protein n=1 Tax=Aspergillus melleus TaxID=138277 RepID=UPI001E8D4367|nr:uncharacterized protein LDX57_007848 [Aspergillus melleus]KAH8430178.1 hypothetical protein LDX57_007848 [Aspergillus melleus]
MAASNHSKISQDAQKTFNSDPSLFPQDKTLTGRGSHSPSMKDDKQSQSVYELWEGVHHGLKCQKPILDDSLQRGEMIHALLDKLAERLGVLEDSNKELARTIKKISEDMGTNK